MDDSDAKIILSLILNSRLTYRQLAEHLDLTLNAVYKRVQNLVDTGVIKWFTAKLNAHAIGAVYAFIYGKSGARDINRVIMDIKENENTCNIVLTSRDFIYIGAFLRSIHELGEYSSFVSNTAEMKDPIVGLRDGSYYKAPIDFIYPKSSMANLDKLDLSIIRLLHKDSRKPISEIADDLGSTPNTIRRRLTRLIDEGLIELTLDFHIEASGDLFSILLLNLKPSSDRKQVAQQISDKYNPNILFCWTFSNLPNVILCWVWTNTINELNLLVENLKGEEIDKIDTDIIRKGMFLDTWLDDLVYKEKI
jgi:DNA-binding Lrp family transcriptional regulator